MPIKRKEAVCFAFGVVLTVVTQFNPLSVNYNRIKSHRSEGKNVIFALNKKAAGQPTAQEHSTVLQFDCNLSP